LLADALDDREAASNSPQESLDWARGRVLGSPTPSHWGTLIPKLVRSDARAEAGDLVADHAAAEPVDNPKPKNETAENDLADAAPERERTDMFTLMARRIRKGSMGRRKGDGSGTMLHGWSSGATRAMTVLGRIPQPLAPSDSDRSGDGATLHPEWDERRGAYRADWCRVRESVVPQHDGVTVSEIVGDSHLRRGIARLARALALVDGQRDGDDIDLDAVIDRQVARRDGHYRDHGVHVARLRVKPELSVMILMDTSSSTGEPLSDGCTVFDEQRSTATALVDAMAAVGLSTAWWAFRSQGRHAVSVEVVKAFDQPADYDMHARAAALRPSGFTRLGAALRHAAKAIDGHAGAGHRLLIALSDGVAFDHGYEGNHADSDARMALLEARSRQIGCLCLSVGVGQDDARLRDTFGAQEYLRFGSWHALRADLEPLLRNAIRASR
jgi:nitric oxide reductase NorD protein